MDDLAQRSKETVILPFKCGHLKAVNKLWASKFGVTTVQGNCPDCARLEWLRNHPDAAREVFKRRSSHPDTALDNLHSLLDKLA